MSARPADYDYCAALLAEGDRDRWLASLFIPEAKRKHVQALYAFSLEMARIRDVISEPRLGEIRLQWWREVLEGERAGEGAQNPVSAALLETMTACRLPAAPLVNLIEARRFDLYADPMPSLNDLEGYCGETCSVLFRLAAMIIGDPASDPDAAAIADAAGHAGVAYALTGILRALPWHARRGQCFLPGDVLARHGALPEAAAAGLASPALLAALAELRARAREHLALADAAIARIPGNIRPAFVPLAVTPLYLRAMEKRGYQPFESLIEPPQWRRQWAMWRWSGLSTVI